MLHRESLRGDSSLLRPAFIVAAACREVVDGPRGEPVGDAGRGAAGASVFEAMTIRRCVCVWRDVDYRGEFGFGGGFVCY